MSLLLLLDSDGNESAPRLTTKALAALPAGAKAGVEHPAPYWWFVEIVVPVSLQSVRFVNNIKPVDYLKDDGQEPITWSNSNFRVQNLVEDSEGDVSNFTIQVTNVSRELQAYLEYFGGLEGAQVRLLLDNQANLLSEQPIIEIEGEVLSSISTAETVALRVGQYNVMRRHFPSRRAQRDFCQHQYGDIFCGYAVPDTSPHFLPSCDMTLDGPSGCVVHGLSEQSANLTVLHPENFGGFPGLTRLSGIGT